MRRHGNRSDNPRPHFLYVIYDFFKQRIYKFGIGQHGKGSRTFERLDRQIWERNRPEFPKERFRGRILKRNLAKPMAKFWKSCWFLFSTGNMVQNRRGINPNENNAGNRTADFDTLIPRTQRIVRSYMTEFFDIGKASTANTVFSRFLERGQENLEISVL